jgi:hypothetical protein
VEVRACQRLAVTVPPLDNTSLERIEELVDAAQWRTALGEALTRLSTALTRRGDYAVRAALCLAKRGGSSQYVKIQFIAASPSLVDREVASYETLGGDLPVDWRYRRASSVEQDLVTLRVPLGLPGRTRRPSPPSSPVRRCTAPTSRAADPRHPSGARAAPAAGPLAPE